MHIAYYAEFSFLVSLKWKYAIDKVKIPPIAQNIVDNISIIILTISAWSCNETC